MYLQVQASALMTLLLLLLIQIEGNSIPNALHQNATSVTSSSSPWLKKVVKQRPSGCRGRPWLCSQGEFPPRSLCCRNRCVNVTSDINNCGLCGIRCPFNWQCCRGLCINTNLSPLNCGRCEHRCPFGIFCLFGMCGYGQEQPLPPPPKQKPPQPSHIQPCHPPGCHQPSATAME